LRQLASFFKVSHQYSSSNCAPSGNMGSISIWFI
jgi:hypothetical protein